MEESVFKSEDKKCIFEAICGCFILKKQDEKHISECSSFFKSSWSKKCFTFFKKGSNVVFLEQDYKDSGYRLINTE